MSAISQTKIQMFECQKCRRRFPYREVGRAYDLLGTVALTGKHTHNIVLTEVKDFEEADKEIEGRVSKANCLPRDEYRMISFKRRVRREKNGRRITDVEYYNCIYCDGESIEIGSMSLEEFEKTR